ncbi:hypothetical protein [Streptomyces globisporus]|uniref:hypothetical protein n=1 Tax=Streptomyces globisporus TaxID=1908 RepID=UPI00068A42B5|nr:hypothetical protein [Streptomyces globisporus]
MRDAIRGQVDALVAIGRPAEARATARGALAADGPDAGLLLALAHAHMAEDDDDHDDAAEQVFREGLDAFPDDIGLLAGYAELCARTDALDRPGRHGRGPVLLARLRELAPGSTELRRSEAAGSSVSTTAKSSVSAHRMQSFDAARAFAEAPTPEPLPRRPHSGPPQPRAFCASPYLPRPPTPSPPPAGPGRACCCAGASNTASSSVWSPPC